MRYEAGVHHRFEVEGDAFLYSADSAAVVWLDPASDGVFSRFARAGGENLFAYLDSLPEETRAEARECFEELVTLRVLRPLGEVPPRSEPVSEMPLLTLVLNVTNKCNLACTYCYEYGEDRIADVLKKDGGARRSRMSAETARRSIDLLFEEAGEQPAVTLTFFGGETLLNFETIRDAVEHAERRGRETGKRVQFSLTTNATLLTDEITDFLVAHGFGVNVSIDGTREDQDRHRVFKSGKGSYDVIVPRIRRLLERNRERGGRPVGARVTLTAGARGVRETYRHLTEELGFRSVGFAPVTSAPDHDYALGDSGLGVVLEEFRELCDDYVACALRGERHGFSNLEDLLRELHQGVDKAYPCGAGLGLVGVSTEGELGLCHRFVESGAHEIGDLESGLDDAKRRAFLADGHISKKVACHDCFARPHCSGGCYHEAYVRYEDATSPNLHYCEWIRAWTALGLSAYGRIARENPSFLERFD